MFDEKSLYVILQGVHFWQRFKKQVYKQIRYQLLGIWYFAYVVDSSHRMCWRVSPMELKCCNYVMGSTHFINIERFVLKYSPAGEYLTQCFT